MLGKLAAIWAVVGDNLSYRCGCDCDCACAPPAPEVDLPLPCSPGGPPRPSKGNDEGGGALFRCDGGDLEGSAMVVRGRRRRRSVVCESEGGVVTGQPLQ